MNDNCFEMQQNTLLNTFMIQLPYYMKFWRHVNLKILKNRYLAAL